MIPTPRQGPAVPARVRQFAGVLAAIAHLHAQAETTPDLARNARSSLVNISQASRDGQSESLGTGFVISHDGLVATSLHVIGESRLFSVELSDGRRPEILELHAWNRDLDLALVRIAATNLAPLPLGASTNLAQGDPVVVLGNPMGLQHSVVEGILSARRKLDQIDMLQLAIPIEPGNSGGPALSRNGKVIGIVNAKSALTPNLGFATPVERVHELLERPNPISLQRWLALGAIDPQRWTPLFGARWRQRAGQILVEGPGAGFGGRALLLDHTPPVSPPLQLTVEVRLDDESGAAGLVFASDGADRHYGFYPTGGQLRLTSFEGPDVYGWRIIGTRPSQAYRKGDWNRLSVLLETNRITCSVNDETVFAIDEAPARGRFGLAKFRNTRATFRQFRFSASPGEPSPSEDWNRWLQAAARLRPAPATIPEPPPGSHTEAYARLQDRARQLESEARQLRHAATEVHQAAIADRLASLLQQPEPAIDLVAACLLLARHDQPDLETESYPSQLARLAAELKPRLEAAADDRARVELLRHFLFLENGFHGSRLDYDHPANSYLNSLLDDREGLPITLSVLFLELARRVGISGVEGVPLPGHFLVKHVAHDGNQQFYDVFNGGQHLTRAEADDLGSAHAGVPVRSEFLAPATKRDIVVRMITNLQAFAERREGPTAALPYASLLVAIAPNPRTTATHRLDRARLHLQAGNRSGAITDFQWIVDHEPPGLDIERIADTLRRLKSP